MSRMQKLVVDDGLDALRKAAADAELRHQNPAAIVHQHGISLPSVDRDIRIIAGVPVDLDKLPEHLRRDWYATEARLRHATGPEGIDAAQRAIHDLMARTATTREFNNAVMRRPGV